MKIEEQCPECHWGNTLRGDASASEVLANNATLRCTNCDAEVQLVVKLKVTKKGDKSKKAKAPKGATQYSLY